MKGATSHKNLRAHSGTFFGMNHQFRLAASLGWMDSINLEWGAGRFVPPVSGHTTCVPSPQSTNRNAECVEREQAHGPAADGGGCDDPTGFERHA